MNILNPQKRDLATFILWSCPFIAVDGEDPNCILPEMLRKKDLVLRIGTDPKVMAMPDLKIEDLGWSATIALQGSHHWVQIPWEACSHFWIGPPFHGPTIVWPTEKAKNPRKDPAPRGLRLVKDKK